MDSESFEPHSFEPVETEGADLRATAGGGPGRVGREPNFHRRHHRVTVPLYLVVGDRTYRAADWSLGGFRLQEYAGDEQPGTELSGTLILPYADFTVHLPVQFRIRRRNGDELGCEYVDLGAVQRKALRHVMEAAVEGRLADVGDAIGTLQEPVPAPQLEQLLEEEDDQHVYLAGRQLFRMSLLYAALGLLALMVAGGLIYRNVYYVDVRDGLIMGNFIPLAAPVEGRLQRVYVREGRFVQAGERLFSLRAPALTLAVEKAQTTWDTARARVAALEGQLEEERSRMRMFGDVAQRQIEETEAAIKRVDILATKALADVGRQDVLMRSGVASVDAYEAAVRDHRALGAEREELESRLALLRLNQTGTVEGRFFGGTEIEGRVRELEETLRVARAQAAEAEQQLEAAMTRLGEATVVAPQDAYVYTVHRQTGELLRSHDIVLNLRTTSGYWGVGRLGTEDALKIRPGQVVDVVIPSLDLRLYGVVSAIGHHSLSSAPNTSPDLESSLHEVPIKIALPQAPADIPPGMRARFRIHRKRLAPVTPGAAPPPS